MKYGKNVRDDSQKANLVGEVEITGKSSFLSSRGFHSRVKIENA